MLDHLRVLAYGEPAPLKSLASVAVREGQTLVVTAFDPQVRRHRMHLWVGRLRSLVAYSSTSR